MPKIKNFLNKKIIKYSIISVLSYFFIYIFMHVFVEKFGIKPQISFFFTYLIAYVFDYTSSLKIVFQLKHTKKLLGLYFCYLFIFFLIGNTVFFLIREVPLSAPLKAILVAFILFPLRFLCQNYIVFKH